MNAIIDSLKRRNKLLDRMKILAEKKFIDCSQLNHIYENGNLILKALVKSYPEMKSQKYSINRYLIASENIFKSICNSPYFKDVECELDENLEDLIDERHSIMLFINGKLQASFFE